MFYISALTGNILFLLCLIFRPQQAISIFFYVLYFGLGGHQVSAYFLFMASTGIILFVYLLYFDFKGHYSIFLFFIFLPLWVLSVCLFLIMASTGIIQLSIFLYFYPYGYWVFAYFLFMASTGIIQFFLFLIFLPLTGIEYLLISIRLFLYCGLNRRRSSLNRGFIRYIVFSCWLLGWPQSQLKRGEQCH